MDILTDLVILSVGGIIGFSTAALLAHRSIMQTERRLLEAASAASLVGYYANKLGCKDDKGLRYALENLHKALGDDNAPA